MRRRVYVSSAAPEPGSERDGIYGFEQDAVSGELVATGTFLATPGASFLAADPGGAHLYATRARQDGAVVAAEIGPDGALVGLGAVSTGAARPCHVSVHPSSKYLFSAHYGSGHLAVHALGADGAIGERRDLVLGTGSGPDPNRQAHAHAHFSWPEPSGRFVLLCDLGTDAVRTYGVDSVSGRLLELSPGNAEPGSGPRHLVACPDGSLLVTGELGSSLLVFDFDPSSGAAHWRASVAASGWAGRGENAPSELALGPGAAFCYVANRGPDSISVFSLKGDIPERVGEVPCGGHTPRHVAIIGDHLYVANQDSGAVVVFALDRDSGLPRPTGATVALERPSCVLALPRE